MPAVVVTDGPLAGRRFEIDSRLLVGRVDADLTIDDELVSRRHAEIRAVAGALEIEDRGSLNGTWVNGERIAGPRVLAPGDVIKLGKTSLEVEHDQIDSGRTVLASVDHTLKSAAEPQVIPPPAPEPPPPIVPVAPRRPEPVPAEPVPVAAEAPAPPVAQPAPAPPPEPEPEPDPSRARAATRARARARGGGRRSGTTRPPAGREPRTSCGP